MLYIIHHNFDFYSAIFLIYFFKLLNIYIICNIYIVLLKTDNYFLSKSQCGVQEYHQKIN